MNAKIKKYCTLILKGYWPLLLLLLLPTFLFLVNLGGQPFSDWDECLYAQYAHEMPQSGHYLTNIWNGYIDMQKPPLYTWLLQIPRMLFGQGEYSLRLLSALSGLGLIAAVYVFSKKYFSQSVAIFASLILLVSELFVIYSLRLNTDIVFTLLVFLGVWSWLESYKKKSFVYIAGLLLGLATMVKGIGTSQFMMAIFLTIFIQPKKEYFINFIKMSLTVAVIAVPWHLIAYNSLGYDFFRVYVLENIIQRGKYPIEFHRERWYFYFLLMFRELRPWLFVGALFPLVFVWNFFKKRSKNLFSTLMDSLQKEKLVVTILIVILIPLASLVRFQTRIAWYVLPLYPFIAIYLAYNLNGFIDFVSHKLLRGYKKSGYTLLVLVVTLLLFTEGSRLLMNESKFGQNYSFTSRELAINEARLQPEPTLEYLVPFGERQAKVILPETEQIDMTWVFGGHPCAVYYSEKKVNYYYDIDEFAENVGKQGVLYMMHKDDISVTEGSEPNIVYSNEEFILFTY